MSAYEIEQIETDARANFRLPLSYGGWADIERRVRQERARALGEGFSKFIGVACAKIAGYFGGVRSTAADCSDARLHHG